MTTSEKSQKSTVLFSQIWKRWFVFGVAALARPARRCGVPHRIRMPQVFVVPGRTLYNPSSPADTPLKENLPFTAFDTATGDGLTLKGWFVPAQQRPAGGTVIILHGTHTNWTSNLPIPGALSRIFRLLTTIK